MFNKVSIGEFGNLFNTNLDFDKIDEIINLSGVTFENRQKIISNLEMGQKIKLIRDPFNKYDKYAIKVVVKYNNDDVQIGWIPKRYAKILAKEIDAGINWEGNICEILGGTEHKQNYGILIKLKIN